VTRPGVVIDWMTVQIGHESGNRWSQFWSGAGTKKKKICEKALLAVNPQSRKCEVMEYPKRQKKL
jgi:hypothetical protein